SSPAWLFDIDSLSQTMNYHPVLAENQSNPTAGFQDTEKAGEEGTQTYVLFPVSNGVSAAGPSNAAIPNLEDFSHNADNVGAEADTNNMESIISVSPIPTTRIHKDHPTSQIIGDLSSTTQTRSMARGVKDQGGMSQMFNEDFHTCIGVGVAVVMETVAVDSGVFGASTGGDAGGVPAAAGGLRCGVVLSQRSMMTRPREAKGKSPVESFTGFRNLSAEFKYFSDNSINEVNDAGTLVLTIGQISLNSTNTFNVVGPSNAAASPTHEKCSYLPYGKRAIGTKWAFKNKKDERGIVVRNKARLFAQGHTQEEGIDYKEVFAPVARIEAIRLFLAYASFMGFMVYQMDVKSAFLYGTTEEEVYVCQPPGFKDPDYPDKKKDRIFISQDKYVAEILKKFRLTDGKLASTPIDTEKPLLKDPDGEDVDVVVY
nr:putative ribonuclease H-like domain-containing protein [Tanacetum cinerariifolium]